MKKLALLVLFAVVLTLCACSRPATETNETSPATAFEKFEKALDGKNITYEKVRMAAEMIGAKEGYKYKTGSGNIEMYEYDKTSSAYQTAEAEQKITSDYGSYDAIVMNGYALMSDDQSIIDLFKEAVK